MMEKVVGWITQVWNRIKSNPLKAEPVVVGSLLAGFLVWLGEFAKDFDGAVIEWVQSTFQNNLVLMISLLAILAWIRHQVSTKLTVIELEGDDSVSI